MADEKSLRTEKQFRDRESLPKRVLEPLRGPVRGLTSHETGSQRHTNLTRLHAFERCRVNALNHKTETTRRIDNCVPFHQEQAPNDSNLSGNNSDGSRSLV